MLALAAGAALEWRVARQGEALRTVVERRTALEQDAAGFAAMLESRGLSLADVATAPEAERMLVAGGVDPVAGLAVVGVGFAAQDDVVIQSVELRAAPLPGTAESASLQVAAAMPADAGATAASPDAAAGCDAGAEATMLVEFGLADGLAVRQRDAALAWIREASAQLAPWRATPAAQAIGRGDALVVTAERGEARADARWAVCLRREVGT